MKTDDLLRFVQANQTAIKNIGDELKVLRHSYDTVKKKLVELETEKKKDHEYIIDSENTLVGDIKVLIKGKDVTDKVTKIFCIGGI